MNHILRLAHFHIDTGSGGGIFHRIAQQIRQHTPGHPTVRQHDRAGIRAVEHRCQVGFFQLVVKFAQCLIHRFNQIQLHNMRLQIAAAGFAQFHQIFNELLQLIGLTGQNLQILLIRLRAVGSAEQIHKIHNRSQRGFDVVGYIGDQFRLHSLGTHLALYRLNGGLRQCIELLGAIPETASQQIRRNLIIQFAARHPARTGDDGCKAPTTIAQHRQTSGCTHRKEDDPCQMPMIYRSDQEKRQRSKQQQRDQQQPLPDDGHFLQQCTAGLC